MASVRCIYCHAENELGEQLCRACFRRLPADPSISLLPADPPPATDEWRPPDAPPDPPSDAPPDPPAGHLPAATPANCPYCGAEVPDPGNHVCVECHRPLGRPQPLRLSFPRGEVTVDAAAPVCLGRDPASSPVWSVFADHENISRLHATVGVDEHGAWVRDERSLNGTYVNDIPLPSGTRITLVDGDILRLAADVTATVQRPTFPPPEDPQSADVPRPADLPHAAEQ